MPSVENINVKETRYLTEDLHGLSHLSNLQSLTVQTRPRPQWIIRRDVCCRSEIPVVPAHKLVALSCLTALHVNVMPVHLVTLTQLQVLDLAQLSLQRLPAYMSALKRLSQLTISGRMLAPSALTPLSTIPALKWLAVNRVPDDLLGPLEALTALNRLDLLGLDTCHLNDHSACLARMTHLTSLHLGVYADSSSQVLDSRELDALQHLLPALTYLLDLDLTMYYRRQVYYGTQVLDGGMFLYPETFVPLLQYLPHTIVSTMGLSWDNNCCGYQKVKALNATE